MDISGSRETQPVPGDWYEAAFGSLYPLVYEHRTVEAAVPEVRFAADAVGLSPDDRALDLCCGTGRHLVTLEQSGARLVGLDFSNHLLAMARSQLKPHTSLVRGDMRQLPFEGAFDVVFSFFTSFGYFLEDTDNQDAANELGRVLRRNGRFFMDYLNPRNVEDTLVPHSSRTVNGHTIDEERWIDRETRRINKRVEVSCKGRRVGGTLESVRLYRRQELLEVLETAGLRVNHIWGDYSGRPYDEDAPRMIVSGVRAHL